MSVDKDLKAFRGYIMKHLQVGDFGPTYWVAGEAVPFPITAVSSRGRCLFSFDLGYGLVEEGAEPTQLLFGTTAWAVKHEPGAAVRVSPGQDPDRQEILQIIHSTAGKLEAAWVWQVDSSRGDMRLKGPRKLDSSSIRSHLLSSFWAGVTVSKELRSIL